MIRVPAWLLATVAVLTSLAGLLLHSEHPTTVSRLTRVQADLLNRAYAPLACSPDAAPGDDLREVLQRANACVRHRYP